MASPGVQEVAFEEESLAVEACQEEAACLGEDACVVEVACEVGPFLAEVPSQVVEAFQAASCQAFSGPVEIEVTVKSAIEEDFPWEAVHQTVVDFLTVHLEMAGVASGAASEALAADFRQAAAVQSVQPYPLAQSFLVRLQTIRSQCHRWHSIFSFTTQRDFTHIYYVQSQRVSKFQSSWQPWPSHALKT